MNSDRHRPRLSWRLRLVGLWLCLAAARGAGGEAPAEFGPSAVRPPAVAQEFRGLWIATVKNIDWPSRPGLPVVAQKSELITLLEQARQLHFNAVLLQVRPASDALYASRLEPWSEYLTGWMGRAPQPFYDPLAFAVEEAHRRGLELHAWFNPYRARHNSALSPITSDHISRRHPQLVKSYGRSLWLDPGSREVQEHVLNVVLDVARRYDIDGVHFDDYFYPYPEKDARGHVLPFPDWASWKRYFEGGGKLGREEWRRENVNLFVMRVSQSLHAIKPWLKFGISPFGIWRPGSPAQVKGLDAYDVLFADSRKWLREGWVDYLAPQLYWGEEHRETSFSALLQWWHGENVKHRQLWPGLDLSRVGPARPAEEIVNQVRQTRTQTGGNGNVFWGIRALTENRRGVADRLLKDAYAEPALPPAFPWLDPKSPGQPRVSVLGSSGDEVRFACNAAPGETPWFWIVQARSAGGWKLALWPVGSSGRIFTVGNRPDVIAVSVADRSGRLSPPAVLERARPAGPKPVP